VARTAAKLQDAILDVRELKTYFYTYDGVVKALDGVSFRIRKGETIGLVGETGCGKSVTAFSITKLIPDPPGRIMGGMIIYKGANLLWGVEKEAKFKPVKNSNRVKVTRSYRRIKAAQERMNAVRGGGISMIFQEPSSAMNPVFSIADQVSEAIFLHRGVELIQTLLRADPNAPDLDKYRQELIQATRDNDIDRMRAAAKQMGDAMKVPTVGTQAYYVMRGSSLDPESKLTDLEGVSRRLKFSGLQRRYLRHEAERFQILRDLRTLYMQEMRDQSTDRRARTRLKLHGASNWARGLPYKLWGIHRHVNRPVKEEGFWQTVRGLEGVAIANPVQVSRGYPHELSGGMIQRVMIAMALASEPELLIADEPTTALDVTIQAQILELMRILRDRVGTAILLITHDLGVIAEVVDRVAVMYAGNIVEIGPVKDVFRRPLHPYTQGLLASIPSMNDPDRPLQSIAGSVPNLIFPPTGCRFHPRCPHAMPICKEARPPMTVEGELHTVACYLYNGPVSRE
jgi:peptide/nickel transport system ATP-binding protein